MQHGRFVVLTGHLNDYPLSDLVGILRHQQKTGRLLIEYPKGPASFYFKDGELVDAQLDNLSGLQAVCVAVAQPASSFNFNPLIQPPKRSIENSLQKVVSELLGCWDENGLEIEAIAPPRSSFQPAFTSQAAPQPALLAAAPSTFNVSPVTRTDQALVFSSVALEVPKSPYSRPVLAMAAAGLMMLGLSTVIAVTGGFGLRGVPAISSPARPANETASAALNAAPIAASAAQQVAGVPAKTAQSRSALGSSSRKTAPGTPRQVAVNSPVRSGERLPASTVTATEQAKPNEVAPQTQSVKVILRIENGRVAQASIANPKPGMDAYEALALRIARQRRYPAKAAGPETVMIKVTQAN
ncbi:MAG: DUF4388 domain-containing protein [Pyrinomonadaceae bacterium]